MYVSDARTPMPSLERDAVFRNYAQFSGSGTNKTYMYALS